MEKDVFAAPKFSPKGSKTIPVQMDPRSQQLGMAIQLGDGGGAGPSKLGKLVRGQLPRPVAPPVPMPAPAAPLAPPARPQPALGAVHRKCRIDVKGVTEDGEEMIDNVELTFPPGTRVTDVQQTEW